jgi:hypothetical protein
MQTSTFFFKYLNKSDLDLRIYFKKINSFLLYYIKNVNNIENESGGLKRNE